VERVKGIEPSS